MAWTAPRTWVIDDVPDANGAALGLNVQIRDNFLILKTPFSDDGKIVGLTAACFTSLDGTAISGIGLLGAGNAWTTGKQNFDAGATTRVVVPVGADKWAAGPASGSIWVETDYLHYIDHAGIEWKYLGTDLGLQAAAVIGSLWIDSTNTYLNFIDESNHQRECISNNHPHTDALGVAGSFWLEDDYLHWIANAAGYEFLGHYNVVHVDGDVHTDDYTFTAHIDVPYDDHPHENGHGDYSHNDVYVVHSNTHADEVHVDDPYQYTEHEDWTDDHTHYADIDHQDDPVLA